MPTAATGTSHAGRPGMRGQGRPRPRRLGLARPAYHGRVRGPRGRSPFIRPAAEQETHLWASWVDAQKYNIPPLAF